MSQPGGPGSGQPPSGPPDWQSQPQQPLPPPPSPASWQASPQPPGPPAPGGGASWQSAPRPPVPPNVPPPPPPSWSAGLTSTAPVAGPAGFVYGDVPNRIIAYIIDAIILGIIGSLISGVVNPVRSISTTTGATLEVDVTAFVIVAAVQIAIGAIYFVGLWSSQRGTLGMKVLGLQIGHETDGRNISMAQGVTRYLVFGIPSILAQFAFLLSVGLGMILGLVGLIWLIALLVSIAQSPTKQGYHDRFAHTIMVKSARRAA